MDKKKKFRVVVMVPVIATLIVAGGAIYFVLQAGASGTHEGGTVYSSEMAAADGDGAEAGVTAAVEFGTVDEAACGDFNSWVGQPINEENVKGLGRPYRIVGPQDPVTMDFNPERVNIVIDDNRLVLAVRCG